VIHVPNRPHVHVRLVTFKLFFAHGYRPYSRAAPGIQTGIAADRDPEHVSARSAPEEKTQTLTLILELTTGIEPVTSSLPRTCSTN
jgi:hypothetical protein